MGLSINSAIPGRVGTSLRTFFQEHPKTRGAVKGALVGLGTIGAAFLFNQSPELAIPISTACGAAYGAITADDVHRDTVVGAVIGGICGFFTGFFFTLPTIAAGVTHYLGAAGSGALFGYTVEKVNE